MNIIINIVTINDRENCWVESQGYNTLMAEYSEKLWKQKMEQFMKRTKSESTNVFESTLDFHFYFIFIFFYQLLVYYYYSHIFFFNYNNNDFLY